MISADLIPEIPYLETSPKNFNTRYIIGVYQG